MDRLYIALAALLGGLAAAYAGYLESHESFDPRKFGGSAIRSVFAAVVFTIGYHLSGPVNMLDLFYAFLGGAGVDVMGNRITSKLGNPSWPLPKSQLNISLPQEKEG